MLTRYVINHPYYYPAPALARLVTVFATMLWASLVMYGGRFFAYATPALINYADPRILAASVFLLALAQGVRFFSHVAPSRIGVAANVLMAVLWIYLADAQVFATPLRATPIATVVTIAIVAFYSLIAKNRTGVSRARL